MEMQEIYQTEYINLNELNKLDINILLISWRGFSGNKGSPTEKNLYKDAEAAIKWLNKKNIKIIRLFYMGSRLEQDCC